MARIADVFGAMVFQRTAIFAVVDPELEGLFDQHLGRDQHIENGLA